MRNKASLILLKHRATYLGELCVTDMHQHGALVLLIGLSGRIRLTFKDGRTIDCRSALLDADVAHSLDPQGELIMTIYSEVDAPETQLLRSLYLNKQPIAYDVVAPAMFLKHRQRSLFEFDLSSILGLDLNKFAEPRLEPRVSKCLQLLNDQSSRHRKQETIARELQLSPSRLNHLFKDSTGIAYRRYRLWAQLALFMRDVKNTNNVTTSALNSGFYDAAHLSNSYRKLLGISPAALLKDLGRFEV